MHLEQELRLQSALRELVVHCEHRALHDVGGCALDRCVDGHVLGGDALACVGRVDLGQRAAAAEHRARFLVLARVLQAVVEVALHAGQRAEVGLDELARLRRLHAGLLREAARAHAVHEAVVDDLRLVAQLRRHHVRQQAVDDRRRARVDVFALLERLDERLVARQVREDAQFDLAVVRGQQRPALAARDECGAHLAAFLGADRDVLQVGIVARQAARRGDCLVERRVHAALAVAQRRQRVDVGALQLRELAPLEQQHRHLVVLRHLLQHFVVGLVLARRRAARLLQRRGAVHFELVEQHDADLLRRAEVEGVARALVHARFELGDALVHLAADGSEVVAVERDALDLHVEQHGHERQLHLVEHRVDLRVREFGFEDALQSQRIVRVFAYERGDRRRIDLVEGLLLLAAAEQFLSRCLLVAESAQRLAVEVVRDDSGFQAVAREHRVERETRCVDASGAERREVALAVGGHLLQRTVREQRSQGGEDRVASDASRRGCIERDVTALARFDAERDAEQLLRMHCARCFGSDGEASGRTQFRDERVEFVLRSDRAVVLRDFVGLVRGGHGREQRVELESREQSAQLVGIGARRAEVGHRDRQRNVGLQRDEPLRQQREFLVGLERRADRGFRHFGSAREQLLQRSELLDQRDRGLLADLRHAGHVVAAVAHEREQVDHRGGRHAPLGFGFGRAEDLRLRRRAAQVPELDVLADDLQEVLVARDEEHVHSRVAALHGKRADHVVRLVAVAFDDGDSVGVDDGADVIELRRHLVGHLLARRLVFGVDRRAVQVLARPVKGKRDRVRTLAREQGPKGLDEPERGPGRVARLGREIGARAVGEREVAAVGERSPVDQVEPFGHGAFVAGGGGARDVADGMGGSAALARCCASSSNCRGIRVWIRIAACRESPSYRPCRRRLSLANT